MRNSFSPRLQLDNEGDSNLGGYSDVSGIETGGEGAKPNNDFVPRKDFEGLNQKYGETERQLRELNQWKQEQSRSQQNSRSEPESPKKPNPKDFDFQKDPEALDRYNDQLFAWKMDAYEKSRAEKERPKIEAQRRTESLNRSVSNFTNLANEFEKENPGFKSKVATQGYPRTYDEVLPMILGSKQAAEVVNHFYQHPEALAELNSVAGQGGETAAAEYLGELRATLKHQKTIRSGNMDAAGVRPIRGNLKGSVGGNAALTPEQIMKF